jgi:hypothetical protein
MPEQKEETQRFETTDDGHPLFFRLDRTEDGPDGRLYIGVVRAGGITKGKDYPVSITEDNFRREGWRPTTKVVPDW